MTVHYTRSLFVIFYLQLTTLIYFSNLNTIIINVQFSNYISFIYFSTKAGKNPARIYFLHFANSPIMSHTCVFKNYLVFIATIFNEKFWKLFLAWVIA